MSELNHELDRDNLNSSAAEEKPKLLNGLSFPSESDLYDRHPSPPLNLYDQNDIHPVQAGRAS